MSGSTPDGPTAPNEKSEGNANDNLPFLQQGQQALIRLTWEVVLRNFRLVMDETGIPMGDLFRLLRRDLKAQAPPQRVWPLKDQEL